MKDRAYEAHRRATRTTAKTSASQDRARYWWTAAGTKEAKSLLNTLLATDTPAKVRHDRQQLSDQARDALRTCSANDAPGYASQWGKSQRILQLLEEMGDDPR